MDQRWEDFLAGYRLNSVFGTGLLDRLERTGKWTS